MVPDLTHCINPTCSGTGVNTLLGNAGQTGSAVIILQTLCSAACSRHWISLVTPDTGADHLTSIILATLSVGPTWRGLTGILENTAWAQSSEGDSCEARQTPEIHNFLLDTNILDILATLNYLNSI